MLVRSNELLKLTPADGGAYLSTRKTQLCSSRVLFIVVGVLESIGALTVIDKQDWRGAEVDEIAADLDTWVAERCVEIQPVDDNGRRIFVGRLFGDYITDVFEVDYGEPDDVGYNVVSRYIEYTASLPPEPPLDEEMFYQDIMTTKYAVVAHDEAHRQVGIFNIDVYRSCSSTHVWHLFSTWCEQFDKTVQYTVGRETHDGKSVELQGMMYISGLHDDEVPLSEGERRLMDVLIVNACR